MRHQHPIRIADDALHERTVTVPHDVPTGRQILEAAGLAPPDGYALFAILPSGDFEDVRLAEPYDLRQRGPERFIAFQADRLFRFTIDRRQISWGHPTITGAILKQLAGFTGHTHDLYQVVPGGQDVLIGDEDIVNLDAPSVERFVSRLREITIIVNGRRKKVRATELTFEQIVALAFDNPPSGDGVQFTVQFTRGPEERPSGALVEGQSVKIKNGMEFDVTSTNRS